MQNSIIKKQIRPKNSPQVSTNDLKKEIESEDLQTEHDHNLQWKEWKHNTKLIVSFILFPISIVLLLLTWFACFIITYWGQPDIIMQKTTVALSYIMTSVISMVLQHYIDKR